MNLPRIIIAGLSGGSGKTLVSLGLARAFVERGLKVKPFKKGPDYIDAAWLGLAAKADPANLDPHIMDRELVLPLFLDRMQGSDLGLVEGNRGLFDGKDLSGSCSTSELSRRLQAPVVLVIDGTKMTRTAAAIVKGCLEFEPGLDLAGVIINRTAGVRHRAMLKAAIEEYTGVPVLGMLPKIAEDPIPERHMGLVSVREYARAEEILGSLARIVEESVDIDAVLAIANKGSGLELSRHEMLWPRSVADGQRPTIGYVRDAALWFYYEENLEALRRAGAELVEVSLLDDDPWPELHGLYLGGGFPETQAEILAANVSRREQVKALADAGMPIYAECGGFMYLGQFLRFQGQEYPMAGVFPVTTEIHAKPQG
ncbi:MAG: cobyrinate a,c-diamide synthase, partial [Desulfovibrio sp.]